MTPFLPEVEELQQLLDNTVVAVNLIMILSAYF